jgi:Glutamate-1-semialdehyde aminotransferase
MYEAGFVSITHTTDILDRTIDAAEEALRETA